MPRSPKPLTTAQLQKIVAAWNDGRGLTATVQAFARTFPVADRTVWYWLGGQQIHPAMAARIRSLEPPRKRKSNPKKER